MRSLITACALVGVLALVARANPPAEQIVVTPGWLAERLQDPTVVILHVGSLRADYDREHIPGARFLWPTVESHKDAATVAYDGTRGYQPVIVLWAEQDVILHDQFRDGHVPAGCGNVRVLEQAVANLPQGITQIRLRADSALYETEVLRWCEDADRRIAYAISADMSEQLRAEIVRLPETAWQVEREEPEAIRHWAEVAYVPSDGDHRKDRPCLRRYLAVRIQKRQGSLFADGSSVRYFAVVTNRTEDGLTILQWHREKAGTVEHAHHVLKNELAAAALPSGKFGA